MYPKMSDEKFVEVQKTLVSTCQINSDKVPTYRGVPLNDERWSKNDLLRIICFCLDNEQHIGEAELKATISDLQNCINEVKEAIGNGS